jgi:hypothetical protein
VSNRPSKKRSSSARVQAASNAGQSGNRAWIIGLVAVIAVGAVIIFAIASSNSGGSGDNITGRKAAPQSLVTKVTQVPANVITTVGAGSTLGLPKPINGKSIAVDGKPGVLYIGAEYCPYCATERWAMVNALSRFGTFTNLQITNSSTSDVDPGTKTFSFYKAGYTSDYIHFTGVETEDNAKAKLETPTPAQQQILATYDAAPYVAANSTGSIPFIYFNGEYLISGATYDVGVLQGKTWDQIATAMQDPSSAVAKGVIGAANGITAAICLTTKNQPANVCSLPVIKSLQTQIKAQSSSASSSTSNSSTLNP